MSRSLVFEGPIDQRNRERTSAPGEQGRLGELIQGLSVLQAKVDKLTEELAALRAAMPQPPAPVSKPPAPHLLTRFWRVCGELLGSESVNPPSS